MVFWTLILLSQINFRHHFFPFCTKKYQKLRENARNLTIFGDRLYRRVADNNRPINRPFFHRLIGIGRTLFKTHDLQHWELFKTFVRFDELNLLLGRTLLDPSLAEKHYHSWTPKQRQRPLGQSRQVPWRWNQWYQFKRLPWTLFRVWLWTKNR